MKRTLAVINNLKDRAVIRDYALAGAVAALYYMEPFDTEDLDIFVLLAGTESRLDPLASLYAELRRLGMKESGAYVIIEGVPVQFLPAYNSLIEEAVAQSRAVSFEGTETRVPSAEHLAAIMVQTGRTKDRLRLGLLMEQMTLDRGKLDGILIRHNLVERFGQWTT